MFKYVSRASMGKSDNETSPYTYNMATTPAGTGAGGCLTAKKGA